MINIGTTFLLGYEACKSLSDPETCRQKIAGSASDTVSAFLASYDACQNLTDKTTCIKIFAPDAPQSPIVPFLIGLAIGFLLKGILK